MNFLKAFSLAIIILINFSAFAANKKKIAPDIQRTQTSLVVDADTGKILHNVNGHERIYPASLTKLMTLYIIFEKINEKKLSLDQQLPVSVRAQNAQPTRLGLRAGEKISTKDAIMAIIVKSANDASIVAAESISGSEEAFAIEMTKKAHQLGMKNSHFYNSSGLPHSKQKSSAIDMAKLTLAIKRDFPEFYPWFNNGDSFQYKGVTVQGHNKVAKHYEGAEGMKTGYTYLAGFNLVTTASKNNKNLIGVVTGSPSSSHRNNKMVKLLDSHFGTQTAFNDGSEKRKISIKKQTRKYELIKETTKKLAKKSNHKKKTSQTKKSIRS